MKYAFVAAGDIVATVPGAPVVLGQPMHRVNRGFVPGKPGKTVLLPALETPHEVDDEVESEENMQGWRRLAMFGDAWPADEATARAFNALYAKPTFKDGIWSRTGAKLVDDAAASGGPPPPPPPPPQVVESLDTTAPPGGGRGTSKSKGEK